MVSFNKKKNEKLNLIVHGLLKVTNKKNYVFCYPVLTYIIKWRYDYVLFTKKKNGL